MMQPIQPSDPNYFTCTSPEDYDRHTYRIVMSDNQYIDVDSYDMAHIEVLDKND